MFCEAFVCFRSVNCHKKRTVVWKNICLFVQAGWDKALSEKSIFRAKQSGEKAIKYGFRICRRAFFDEKTRGGKFRAKNLKYSGFSLEIYADLY